MISLILSAALFARSRISEKLRLMSGSLVSRTFAIPVPDGPSTDCRNEMISWSAWMIVPKSRCLKRLAIAEKSGPSKSTWMQGSVASLEQRWNAGLVNQSGLVALTLR